VAHLARSRASFLPASASAVGGDLLDLLQPEQELIFRQRLGKFSALGPKR